MPLPSLASIGLTGGMTGSSTPPFWRAHVTGSNESGQPRAAAAVPPDDEKGAPPRPRWHTALARPRGAALTHTDDFPRSRGSLWTGRDRSAAARSREHGHGQGRIVGDDVA